MPVTTNANFDRLVQVLGNMGPDAQSRASQDAVYQKFRATFPVHRLPDLSADEYCVGKGDKNSFCWWLERGLQPVLGRYMPGTARGHLLYWEPDGRMYKNRKLADLSDQEALRYALAIQHVIAAAELDDLAWIDDDAAVYARAHLEPRVTVGDGRKLRLLACYHPDDVMLVSSSEHLGHFLEKLGMPAAEIPPASRPVARMLALREYMMLARESVPALSTQGFMRALYGEAAGISPPKRKEDWDDAGVEDDFPASAYLLTWNPENSRIGGDGELRVGEDQRWTCGSTQPKSGDRVYMVRLGQEPRGIVATGVVTQGSEEAPHWQDPSKTARYIRFRVEEWRPTAAAGLLPLFLLNVALPEQKWSPQRSGIAIPDEVEERLRALWASGRGVHSLRQFVDWETRERQAQHQRWLADYRSITELARALRHTPDAPETSALHRLWAKQDNGISNTGSGTLSREEFESNQDLLAGLTREILLRPDASTMSAVEQRWQDAVQAKRFRKRYSHVIRRVFAAASPETCTSILQPHNCQKLLKILREQFELQAPSTSGTDWIGMNSDIRACMTLAGLDNGRPLENNVAMWELVKERTDADAEDAQDSAPTLNEPVPQPLARVAAGLRPPQNIVLYGPPGTGKTFATIRVAVELVAPELLEGEIPPREELKRKFDELAASGQIVFTTFHQSYSYEDFVEGLRANSKDGSLEYAVEAGVFRRLCERAAAGRLASDDPFDQALVRLRAKAEESEDGRVKMTTSRGKVFHSLYEGGDTFRIFPESTGALSAGYTASMRLVRELFRGADDSQMYNASYVRGMLRYLQQQCGLPSGPPAADSTRAKPFVLVIDEINRGSISRIFGELITLIEPSKRAGMPEALEVTLPYSKERFSVPANLHIVATMNTADRSLTGMDIALRRRFRFVETPPMPELLDEVFIRDTDVCVGVLLRAMNERIELLLDRDHCLGHAMFMPLREHPTLVRLEEIFRGSVLPLLQEYFFDDWQRIQWVLNDHRKPAELRFVRKPKLDLERLFGGEVPMNEQAQRWEVNDGAFRIPEAYAAVAVSAAS